MSSISIISAVAARIQLYLQDDSTVSDKSKISEAGKLLPCLENIGKVLKDADQEIRQKKEMFDLENEIVQLSYDIDDVIEGSDSMIQQTRQRRRNSFMAMAHLDHRSNNVDLGSLRKSLEKLESEIQAGVASSKTAKTSDLENPAEKNLNLGNPIPAATSTGGDEDPAQMAENQVMEALMDENLRVISIWGAGGVGKSTLAKKAIYQNKVRNHFERFAWISINHDFQTKKVFQDILVKLLPDDKVEIMAMDEIQLTLKIFKELKEKKCLVVLEDLRDRQDWLSIRIAFPIYDELKSKSKSKSKPRSKILITTPSKELADMAAGYVGVFEMKPLTEAQCFKILEDKADFDPDESNTVGKVIFSLSGNLPLIAIILGRALKTQNATARTQLLHELNSFLRRTQSTSKGTTQALGLSYDRLPHELKPCLLYMGLFPRGKNIDADKLYFLLAAEGLVLPEEKTISIECIRKMLETLTFRRLVEAEEDKVSATRMYKSCRLHAEMREFCISRGGNEDFFEIVDFKDRKKVKTSTRRLAVYLGKYEDGDEIHFLSQDTVKKIRSLLIFDTFDTEENEWPDEIYDLKEFSHLRVLDFDRVDFRKRKFPKGIDKLILLRYLSFRDCYLEILPISMTSKFPCLETLDLRVDANCIVTIPNVLSNLKRLKHLYFPLVYKSDHGNHDKLQLQGLITLEILINFDTEVCNINDLYQLHSLKMLTTISQGSHNELEGIINYLDDEDHNLEQSSLDIKNYDCFSRERTTIFKKLLSCKFIHSLRIEGQIGDPLENVEISQNFTEMVFNGSELEEDPMSVLGKLEDLRSLTLCNDAFIGTEITISPEYKFPELRILKLRNLQYLEKVTFKKGVMPKLSTLVIDKCEDLKLVEMSKALDSRLRLAQGKKGDDDYFVQPPPVVTNYDTLGNPTSTSFDVQIMHA